MLDVSVKNFLACLVKSSGYNEYEIEFRGKESNYIYVFQVKSDRSNMDKDVHTKPKLSLLMKKCDSEVRFVVNDIDTLILKDKELIPSKCVETVYKGEEELYERNTLKVHYPAQLYLKLFKLMRDRVCFIFEAEGKQFQCYYVDGKVLYIEETENEYKVMGSNLFHLATIYPEYNILMVSYPLKRHTYGDYLDIHREIAKKLNKEYIKVIKDKVVKDEGDTRC